MDSSTQLSLSPPRVLPRRKRKRGELLIVSSGRRANPRNIGVNKHGIEGTPDHVVARRRAKSKAARKARRAAR